MASLNAFNFQPGQFACPLVFTKRFPLHWRLQPNVAIKFLTTDVLRLFTVINKPNMFVIERDGSIVYCKIYEETIGTDTDGSPETVYGSPVQTLSGKTNDDDTQTLVACNTPDASSKRDLVITSSSSPRNRSTNNSRSSTNEKRELVLEVYGIDLPAWVEKEFVNLIENRLVSQITLNEIQQYFVRNSTSKPTPAVRIWTLKHNIVLKLIYFRMWSLFFQPRNLPQTEKCCVYQALSAVHIRFYSSLRNLYLSIISAL